LEPEVVGASIEGAVEEAGGGLAEAVAVDTAAVEGLAWGAVVAKAELFGVFRESDADARLS
jgi:hypothetical protein